MVESKQCHGSTIVERYRTVVNLDPNWDEAFYDFGKYYEYLYHDSFHKDQEAQQGKSFGGGKCKAKYIFCKIL